MSYATTNDNGLRSKVGEKIRSFYYDDSITSNPRKFYNNLKFIIMYGDTDSVGWALEVMYKGIVGLISAKGFSNRVVEYLKNDKDIDKMVKKINDALIESDNFYYVYIFLAILHRIMDGEFLTKHLEEHNKNCENLYEQCTILKALRCVYDNWREEEGWNKAKEMFNGIIDNVYSYCYADRKKVSLAQKIQKFLEQTSCEN